MASTADFLRDAIRNRKQVTCYYDSLYREMCPHAIGWKGSAYRVISFQFGGESSKGLPPGGQWKCMEVAGLTNVILRDGPWLTGASYTKPQTCIDAIEREINY
jgi:hypothetical protein